MSRSPLVIVAALVTLCGVLQEPSSKAAPVIAQHWSHEDCTAEGNKTSIEIRKEDEKIVCHLRRTTIPLSAPPLSMFSTSGKVEVIGEDRKDALLEARIFLRVRPKSVPGYILPQFQIDIYGDRIQETVYYDHPRAYEIHYKLRVPRQLSMEIQNTKGDIAIAHLDGAIRFENSNGKVKLVDLSGEVNGHTDSGQIKVELSGDHWQGKGLFAETKAGDIELVIPDRYSAHLEASSLRGSLKNESVDAAETDSKNQVEANIGNGGSTIRLSTIKGAVNILRASQTSSLM